jgi:hypothetical protein
VATLATLATTLVVFLPSAKEPLHYKNRRPLAAHQVSAKCKQRVAKKGSRLVLIYMLYVKKKNLRGGSSRSPHSFAVPETLFSRCLNLPCLDFAACSAYSIELAKWRRRRRSHSEYRKRKRQIGFRGIIPL